MIELKIRNHKSDDRDMSSETSWVTFEFVPFLGYMLLLKPISLHKTAMGIVLYDTCRRSRLHTTLRTTYVLEFTSSYNNSVRIRNLHYLSPFS